MNTRRIGALLLALCLCLACLPALAQDTVLEGAVAEVDKYGNLTLDITCDQLDGIGWAPGDILHVAIGTADLDAPLGTAYSDVDTGSVVVRTKQTEGVGLIVAINMGNFSQTYAAEAGAPATLTMAVPGGYLDEYNVRQLAQYRTNERADYASDEIFANFRPIVMAGIGEGKLYRCSSPVNDELGRAATADALVAGAGIATVVNLADSAEAMEGYFAAEGFASGTYKALYEDGHVVLLDMGVDFSTPEFKDKLAEGLRFMIDNPAPYLIHCNEGKDRAGFTSLLLEALMGAQAGDIAADYMESFTNYYHVELDSEQYNKVAESNAMGMLRDIAGLEKGDSLDGVDLVAAAEAYLTGIGLSTDEIAALKAALA